MKKLKLLKLLALLVVGIFATAFFTTKASATIRASKHDFSTESWNSSGEVCVVCHTPHRAQSTTQVPLWNHQTTTSTFTLFTSPTLTATLGQPDGPSKACLSCHDGTVALDSFGYAIDFGTRYIGFRGLIETDLTNDHPISFVYDAALATADGELATPQSASTVDGTVPLFSSKVQCSTCHDVHNTANQEHLLVKSNAGSALCFTCHVK